MFRYFGFQWDPAAPSQADFVRKLDESLQHAQGWERAFACPGLHVYTTGSRPGVNEIHPLLFDRGVILGRVFRRRRERSECRDIAISTSESHRILRSGGRALIDDYWGRYAAVLRAGPGEANILRDPSGTLPCYRASVEGIDFLFSWLDDLIAFTHSPSILQVNWSAIKALLSLGHLGGPNTALEGVRQILPGILTPLSGDGPSTSLWSQLAIAKNPVHDDPQAAANRLRQVTMDCVAAWSSCYERVLLRLSGGVDSAILLGCLSTSPTTTRITCLNYHSPGADSDERRFARLAATKAGVELIERERDAAFRLESTLAVSPTPTPELYVGRMDTGHMDAELARANRAPAIFTGAGGDQLFLQLRKTWPAADYLGIHGWGRGFLQASVDAARLGRVSLWHAMRDAIANQRHRTSPSEGVGRFFTLIRREALDAVGDVERYVHPDLPNAADLPIGKFHHLQQLVNPVGYYDPYLREAAPELVNPLLSQPLVELCLSLPTWTLTLGGRGRGLARRAFAPELPREIANRQSKGGMEEYLAAVLHRSLPLARQLLLDGHLARQGLLDRQKVEAVLADRPSAMGSYLGEIHHHIATEVWLQRIAASRTCLQDGIPRDHRRAASS